MKRSFNAAQLLSNGFVIESLIFIAILIVLPFVVIPAFLNTGKCSMFKGAELDSCLNRERPKDLLKVQKS